MLRWELEGRYYCTKFMVIMPFWFSAEHHWTAITAFWLLADNIHVFIVDMDCWLSRYDHVLFYDLSLQGIMVTGIAERCRLVAAAGEREAGKGEPRGTSSKRWRTRQLISKWQGEAESGMHMKSNLVQPIPNTDIPPPLP